jgi:hypothetical protein
MSTSTSTRALGLGNAVPWGIALASALIACGGSDAVLAPIAAEEPLPVGSGTGNAPGDPVTPGTPSAPGTPGTPSDPGTPVTPAVRPTAAECFAALAGPVGADYDKFGPKILPSCSGTQHQDIQGVEKVVFLGDSITVGTPPTLPGDFYRNQLAAQLRLRFGAGLEVKSCADWGARTDDLLEGKTQIARCWPNGTESKRTLVVMTTGGNDVAAWAQKKLPTGNAIAMANDAAKKLRDAIDWLKKPGRFSNGVYVTFANVYEFTDTSADLSSCPAAGVTGFSGQWPDGRAAIAHLEEQYMKIAVETQTDLVFLFESFCGHGYKRKDASLQCYRGANADLLFDLTCIHPTPKGHTRIAGLFENVIKGQ